MADYLGLIMAAGYGSRLQPLTDHIPKPLLPFFGPPLLFYTLSEFYKAGHEQVYVNVHHLKDQFFSWETQHPFSKIEWIIEEPIFGSAGTLGTFKDMDQHVCVVNADIAFSCDLNSAYQHHLSEGAAITILCNKNDSTAKQTAFLEVDKQGNVTSLKGTDPSFYASGIFFYSPEVIQLIPTKQYPYSFAELFAKAVERGLKIRANHCVDTWYDLGESVASYFLSQRTILKDDSFFEKLQQQFLDPLQVEIKRQGKHDYFFIYDQHQNKKRLEVGSFKGLCISQNATGKLKKCEDSIVLGNLDKEEVRRKVKRQNFEVGL